MSGERERPSDYFRNRSRPVGLVSDGLYDRGHRVRLNGYICYLPPGPSIAVLRSLGYEVEVVDIKRKGADRPPIGGAQDD